MYLVGALILKYVLFKAYEIRQLYPFQVAHIFHMQISQFILFSSFIHDKNTNRKNDVVFFFFQFLFLIETKVHQTHAINKEAVQD